MVIVGIANIIWGEPRFIFIHKAISERPRDWEDIQGVILRQGKRLGFRYTLHWLRYFSKPLERDLLTPFQKIRRQAK